MTESCNDYATTKLVPVLSDNNIPCLRVEVFRCFEVWGEWRWELSPFTCFLTGMQTYCVWEPHSDAQCNRCSETCYLLPCLQSFHDWAAVDQTVTGGWRWDRLGPQDGSMYSVTGFFSKGGREAEGRGYWRWVESFNLYCEAEVWWPLSIGFCQVWCAW